MPCCIARMILVLCGALNDLPSYRKKISLCSWRAEMFGAANAVDPQTGRHFEDTVPILQSIDRLSDADRSKITEGTARKVYSRLKVGASGSGTERQGRGKPGTPGYARPAA